MWSPYGQDWRIDRLQSDSILAIDIGGGTQDILFWDPFERLENCIKLVLPSPTRIAAKYIRAVTAQQKALFLDGLVMGGGSVNDAVREHILKGFKVYANPEAALTLHDNLDYVRDMGITLVEIQPPDTEAVHLGDLNLKALGNVMDHFGVEMPSQIAVAVQDHGFSPRESNRVVRFRSLSRFLDNGGRLLDRVYETPPEENTRMWAVKKECPHALVMDTGTAAIMGALLDSTVAGWKLTGVLVVNLGNAHILAALIVDERVLALYEHHTHCLNPDLLNDHLSRFVRGQLTFSEVYDGMGHGAAYSPDFNPSVSVPVAIIGPQRSMAGKTGGYFAVPFGDMMLTGCFGLIEGARSKWNIQNQINA
jgi:uncharacterized protein (DUF1786 family)